MGRGFGLSNRQDTHSNTDGPEPRLTHAENLLKAPEDGQCVHKRPVPAHHRVNRLIQNYCEAHLRCCRSLEMLMYPFSTLRFLAARRLPAGPLVTFCINLLGRAARCGRDRPKRVNYVSGC
jgi:hypothetical protein